MVFTKVRNCASDGLPTMDWDVFHTRTAPPRFRTGVMSVNSNVPRRTERSSGTGLYKKDATEYSDGDVIGPADGRSHTFMTVSPPAALKSSNVVVLAATVMVGVIKVRRKVAGPFGKELTGRSSDRASITTRPCADRRGPRARPRPERGGAAFPRAAAFARARMRRVAAGTGTAETAARREGPADRPLAIAQEQWVRCSTAGSPRDTGGVS